MIEVYDIEDTSFLKQYEKYFLEENYQTNNQFSTALKNMPQYLIEGKDYINDLVSHYSNVFYPDWNRIHHRSYVFKFEANKPTMVPHIDIDPETCKKIKGLAKRVIIYANPIWNSEWGGGTYFAPFENYKASKHYTARVSREKFANEATLVQNVPGRAILFDVDEWHMPQEFTEGNVQRLVFSFAIVHPDFAKVVDFERSSIVPDNDNGVPVASLSSDTLKNDVKQHINDNVVDYIIKNIKQ